MASKSTRTSFCAVTDDSPRLNGWSLDVLDFDSVQIKDQLCENIPPQQDGEECRAPAATEKGAVRKEKNAKKLKPLTLNIANARSSQEVLTLAGTQLGWDIHESRAQEESTVIWVVSDDQIRTYLRKGLSDKQHCAKILGMSEVCAKCAFASMLSLAEALAPGTYPFFPRTWVLPGDMESLRGFMSERSEPLIVKPDEGAQGDGIFIATDYNDLVSRLRTAGGIEGKGDVIVQRYIARPMLLDGLKFDLRVYVLVVSLEPLTVLVCREGLARFCTAPYQKPTTKNLHHLTSHLTNYSLNKRSDTFVHGEDGTDGSKRTISAVFEDLEGRGAGRAEELWGRIESMVGATCSAMQPFLLNNLRETAAADRPPNMRGYDGGNGCFHVLGFDVMLDSDATPWLLEVNCSPRLAIDTIEPLAKGETPPNPRDVCRCMEDHRPHIHVRCPVDEAVKTKVLAGALAVVIGSAGRWKRVSETNELCALFRQVCGPSVDGPVGFGHVTDHVIGEGGGGMLRGLLEVYERVSGARRRVDGARLRQYVKGWGVPGLALHTVDTLYSTFRSKGRFGFDEFIAFLRGMVAKAFPAQSVDTSLRLLIAQHNAAAP